MAPDGPIALEVAHIQPPDLVRADVMMPDMDGFELCGSLKELALTRDIPMVMVTAKRPIDDLKKEFNSGAMDYIRKPFEARELVLRAGRYPCRRR